MGVSVNLRVRVSMTIKWNGSAPAAGTSDLSSNMAASMRAVSR